MVDVQSVYDRFLNALEVQKIMQTETARMTFTEMELKQILYLLGELKAIKGE